MFLCRGPIAIRLLRILTEGRAPSASVFGQTGKSLALGMKRSARFIGLRAPLTPHCLGQGGATWHFSAFGNVDLATHHGRSALARTARLVTDSVNANFERGLGIRAAHLATDLPAICNS